jgi:hypothetical protein
LGGNFLSGLRSRAEGTAKQRVLGAAKQRVIILRNARGDSFRSPVMQRVDHVHVLVVGEGA